MDPRLEIQTCAYLLTEQRASPDGFALSDGEKMRARAIVSTTRRAQFLAGRWLAKQMLARALGGSPQDWRISAEPNEKPRVIGHDLQLSIAHSGPFVACCIADQAVGIDVERLDRVRPIADMSTLVFSEHEQNALRGLRGEAAVVRFFQLWTCKEARLKQLGLPFDLSTLRTIQVAPVESAEAQVGTWCFLGPERVMLSLAVQGLSQLHVRWPAHWVAEPIHWHRYSELT